MSSIHGSHLSVDAAASGPGIHESGSHPPNNDNPSGLISKSASTRSMSFFSHVDHNEHGGVRHSPERLSSAFSFLDLDADGLVGSGDIRGSLSAVYMGDQPSSEEVRQFVFDKEGISERDLDDLLERNTVAAFDPVAEAFQLYDPAGTGFADERLVYDLITAFGKERTKAARRARRHRRRRGAGGMYRHHPHSRNHDDDSFSDDDDDNDGLRSDSSRSDLDSDSESNVKGADAGGRQQDGSKASKIDPRTAGKYAELTPEEEMAIILDIADVDGDGKISLEDFRRMIEENGFFDETMRKEQDEEYAEALIELARLQQCREDAYASKKKKRDVNNNY